MTEEFDIQQADEGDHSGSQLILPDQILPDVIHLVPVTTRPFFPAQIQPVVVDADPWQDTLKTVADSGGQPLAGLVYAPELLDWNSVDALPEIGCVVRLLNAAAEGDKIQFGFQRGDKTFTAEMKKDEVSIGGRRRRGR